MTDNYSDYDLVVMLAGAGGGGCSLAKTPQKDNWVDEAGSLPNYICSIAKEVAKGGKSTSSAIAIAVSRVKAWAAGGDNVSAATRAKAAKAVAEWNALKAKAKGGKVVKATNPYGDGYLMFTASFNTDVVRGAWDKLQSEKRKAARQAAKDAGDSYYDSYEAVPYTYIRELWTDHIIVQVEGTGGYRETTASHVKVPYTVDDKNTVTFGEPVEVQLKYIETADELTKDEKAMLSAYSSPLDNVIALSNTL